MKARKIMLGYKEKQIWCSGGKPRLIKFEYFWRCKMKSAFEVIKFTIKKALP